MEEVRQAEDRWQDEGPNLRDVRQAEGSLIEGTWRKEGGSQGRAGCVYYSVKPSQAAALTAVFFAGDNAEGMGDAYVDHMSKPEVIASILRQKLGQRRKFSVCPGRVQLLKTSLWECAKVLGSAGEHVAKEEGHSSSQVAAEEPGRAGRVCAQQMTVLPRQAGGIWQAEQTGLPGIFGQGAQASARTTRAAKKGMSSSGPACAGEDGTASGGGQDSNYFAVYPDRYDSSGQDADIFVVYPDHYYGPFAVYSSFLLKVTKSGEPLGYPASEPPYALRRLHTLLQEVRTHALSRVHARRRARIAHGATALAGHLAAMPVGTGDAGDAGDVRGGTGSGSGASGGAGVSGECEIPGVAGDIAEDTEESGDTGDTTIWDSRGGGGGAGDARQTEQAGNAGGMGDNGVCGVCGDATGDIRATSCVGGDCRDSGDAGDINNGEGGDRGDGKDTAEDTAEDTATRILGAKGSTQARGGAAGRLPPAPPPPPPPPPGLILLGFSKGGVVVNQILAEVATCGGGTERHDLQVAPPQPSGPGSERGSAPGGTHAACQAFANAAAGTSHEEVAPGGLRFLREAGVGLDLKVDAGSFSGSDKCHERGSSESNLHAFAESIVEAHFVDVGLNCRGGHLTDPRILEGLVRGRAAPASHAMPPGLRIYLHGTPRQWRDKKRPWIRQEKDRFMHLLEDAQARVGTSNLVVCDRMYFEGAAPSMRMHFGIIEALLL